MEALGRGVAVVKSTVAGVFAKKPAPVHHPYKMVMIGETGSGKTSFLNLLCNCGLIDALGFEEGSAKFRRFNDIHLENAIAHQMESKTNSATLYNVELGDLKIGVIAGHSWLWRFTRNEKRRRALEMHHKCPKG